MINYHLVDFITYILFTISILKMVFIWLTYLLIIYEPMKKMQMPQEILIMISHSLVEQRKGV